MCLAVWLSRGAHIPAEELGSDTWQPPQVKVCAKLRVNYRPICMQRREKSAKVTITGEVS